MPQQVPISDFYNQQTYYNHGDNPALKKFVKIAQANAQQGKILDHRTLVLDRSTRFLMARNWDDFLQRDLKAITFPRAFAILTLNTMAFITVSIWTKRLLPIGRFGIRNVYQTSFYRNFGPIGLLGAGGMFFGAAYTEWKTLKFTAFKFYRHVIKGDRNWIYESLKTSKYNCYEFLDNPLANENTFPLQLSKLVAAKKRNKPTGLGGPYQPPAQQAAE